MVKEKKIKKSKEIQKRTGKTFYVATKTLPKRIRRGTYILYAFFRTADEIVDDINPDPPSKQLHELTDIEKKAKGQKKSEDPVIDAFNKICKSNNIPDKEIEKFISSMKMDIKKSQYETQADLDEYLRGSSVSVAYMMLELMDPDRKEKAKPHAAALGKAFQLTNFLRDVREDIEKYGRIYIPKESLKRHGITKEQIKKLEYSENFAKLIENELRKTERLYRKGIEGIEYMPNDCKLPIVLSAILYSEHHRLIRKINHDVLSNTPTLSLKRRIKILSKTLLYWYIYNDKKDIFYKLSSIPKKPIDPEKSARAKGKKANIKIK